MGYLSIRRVLPLRSVIKHKALLPRKEQLNLLFEREFVRFLGDQRTCNPDIGGKNSQLCRLVTMYYLSTLEVTMEQEIIFDRIQKQLSKGRASVRASQETGIAFEIEKDVDRTFLDKAKFTEVHRHGLSIVLRTIAELEKEVGYV